MPFMWRWSDSNTQLRTISFCATSKVNYLLISHVPYFLPCAPLESQKHSTAHPHFRPPHLHRPDKQVNKVIPYKPLKTLSE
nr:MAG TPA: hypothetical protein [Caudoviricetes sp.]